MPAPPMIMIVRHAEKPTKANRQLGVRPDGDHDGHSLSVRGWTRAGALVGLFVPQHGEPKAGLRRPDAIYASGHADDGSRRPVQTVTPLAERLGQHIHRRRGLGDEEVLAAKLAVHDGATLVAWHHEAIPDIARSLRAVDFPHEWPDDRFDVVWTFTRDGTGWRFAQVPQLLLAGDRPDPIG
jgi:broad specificity phosphatase PhoE